MGGCNEKHGLGLSGAVGINSFFHQNQVLSSFLRNRKALDRNQKPQTVYESKDLANFVSAIHFGRSGLQRQRERESPVYSPSALRNRNQGIISEP